MSLRMGLVIPESAGLFSEALSPLSAIFKSIIGVEEAPVLESSSRR